MWTNSVETLCANAIYQASLFAGILRTSIILLVSHCFDEKFCVFFLGRKQIEIVLVQT